MAAHDQSFLHYSDSSNELDARDSSFPVEPSSVRAARLTAHQAPPHARHSHQAAAGWLSKGEVGGVAESAGIADTAGVAGLTRDRGSVVGLPFERGAEAAGAAAGDVSCVGGACSPSSRAVCAPLLSARESVIGLEEIHFTRRIGAGVAGTTYAARWNGVRVAVKVAGTTFASLEGWQAEVALFAKLRHPNVVQYLGCVMSPPTFCLVLEYCEGGDVFRALRKPTAHGFFLNVARGAGAGIAYLHKQHIVHRDLKSANVLLDRVGRPKITDFGVSTLLKAIELQMQQGSDEDGGVGGGAMEHSTELLTAEMGTYRWMAPEVVRHEGYSKPADIFSYGMLLFELLTHEVPFASLPPLQSALAIGLQGLRPPLPPGTPPSIAELVRSCWAEVPAARPKHEDLLRLLQQAERRLTPAESAWLDQPRGHPVYAGAEVVKAAAAHAAATPPSAASAQPGGHACAHPCVHAGAHGCTHAGAHGCGHGTPSASQNIPEPAPSALFSKGMALSPLPEIESSPRMLSVRLDSRDEATDGREEA